MKGAVSAHKTLSIVVPLAVSGWIGLLIVIFTSLTEPETSRPLAVGGLTIFVLTLLLVNKNITAARLYFSVGSTVFWALLFAEAALVRRGTLEEAFEGTFHIAAMGEMLIWVICMVYLGLITVVRPGYLKIAFEHHNYRWIVLFMVLSLASAFYSPRPLYSLAWGLKLALTVMSLLMLAKAIKDVEGFLKFFKVVHISYTLVSLMPLIQVLVDQSVAFQGGRLGGVYAPPAVSASGGMLLLLSSLLSSTEQRAWLRTIYWLTGIGGLLILLIGGGKAAIVFAVVSVVIFYRLIGKMWISMTFLVIVSLLGIFSFFTSLPIMTYLQRYKESGLFETLTGRTVLWEAAIDAISTKPFFGHGYVASKFFSISVSDVLWPAGHMHNAFLEVMYNNGLLGLVPILAMNIVIGKNLRDAIRKPIHNKRLTIIVSGLLALYLFLFMDGLITSSFGGRPHSGFMLFLALVVLSERLRRVEPSVR